MSNLLPAVLSLLKDAIYSYEDDFNLSKTQLNFKREAQFALQILESSPYLAKCAMEDPSSLKNSIMNVALIGLSLNPATKLAYLVPRKKVCLDIGYVGLIKLATDCGSVAWVKAELVFSNDTFNFMGMGLMPQHIFNPFSDRGNCVGVYCVAKLSGGDYLTEMMSKEECFDIRDRSDGYKSSVKNGTQTPWTTDTGEMIKKTVVKRASKMWVKTERSEKLFKAIEINNEHEGINFNNVVDDPLASDELLASLESVINSIPGDTEAKLLKHLSDKYKISFTSLDKLSECHASYAINFLAQYAPSRKLPGPEKAELIHRGAGVPGKIVDKKKADLVKNETVITTDEIPF